MGLRGFEWAIYLDDEGNRWLMRVDADYYADPDRGWSARTSEDVLIWPQGWMPRAVEGIEDTGIRQRTRIGSTSAPLWTREVTSFVVNASGELPVSAVVTRYLGERTTPAPPPIP